MGLMKKHWLAFVLSVVSGIIVGLPHLLISRIIAPAKYDPLQFSSGEGSSITMEEVYTYVPEVREILEGKIWVSDTQVAEYNGKPNPFIGETGLAWIMAGMAKLTGSTESAFIVADFIFPALTFLLAYAIVWVFTQNRIISSAAGVTLVLWPELVVLFPYPNSLISSAKAAIDPRDFLFIARNFHPQLSLPAYLGAFLLVILAIKKKKIWLSILAGVSVGFLFYTYIFNWTAFVFGIAIFTICGTFSWKVSQTSHRRQQWRHFFIVAVITGLLAIPYFVSVWQFRASSLAQDFFAKLSLPKRGFFDLTARHWIFVLLFLIVDFRYLWRTEKETPRKREESPLLRLERILLVCLWIAPLILPDLMQSIFGRDLEGKHWVRRIGYPFSIIGLAIVASQIVNKKWIKLVFLPLILVVLAYGSVRQINMSLKSATAYAQNPTKQELYDWVNQNTPPGSVIASLGWDTVVNIPAKTHAFNFSPIGMRTIAPTDEAIDRFLWAAALYGANDEYIERAFSARGEGTTRALYFKFAEGDEEFAVPLELTSKIKQRYQIIITQNLKDSTVPFRLDYLLIGETEKKLLELSGGKVNGVTVFANKLYNLVRYTR